MQLKEYLLNHIQLPESFLDILNSKFKKATFEKGEFLLKKGEISDKIYFVAFGVLREFSFLEPESEITLGLISDQEWIYQVESFEMGIPSKTNIQVVEKAKLFYIKKEVLELLLAQHHEVALIFLKIYQKYLVQLETRIHLLQLRNVEDRLALFMQVQPNIQQAVPQKMIASYLNTTASNLSKVRSKLLRKK